MERLTHSERPVRCRRWMGAHGWFLAAMAALIVLRLCFLHSDPSDYPQDRNTTMGMLTEQMIRETPLQWNLARVVRQLSINTPLLPEYPFIEIWAWFWQRFGINLTLAGRTLSLLSAIVTGWLLYVISRRALGRKTAALGVFLYAICPLSILIGRCFINDGFMMACVLGSFVAAMRRRWPLPVRAAVCAVAMSLAALAKLPAVFYLPATMALLALHEAPWRKNTWLAWKGTLLACGLLALTVYLAACFWYGVQPLNPVKGYHSIGPTGSSANYTMNVRLTPLYMKVFAWRLAMGLTIPGMLLALLGLILLPVLKHPQRTFWLWSGSLCSLLLVWYCVNQNEYYSYVATLFGAPLIAAGIRHLWRGNRLGCVAALAVSLLFIPREAEFRHQAGFLAIRPQCRHIREDNAIPRGRALYESGLWQELSFYTGVAGSSALLIPPRPQFAGACRSGQWDAFMTSEMLLSDYVKTLMPLRPLVKTRGLEYALFDLKGGLPGRSFTPADPSALKRVPLADQLNITGVRVTTPRVEPGREFEIEVDFEKLPAYQPGKIILMMEFVHLPSGEHCFFPPRAGAFYGINTSMPMLQPPVFDTGPFRRMSYRFLAPPLMPDGPYGICISRAPVVYSSQASSRAQWPATAFDCQSRAPVQGPYSIDLIACPSVNGRTTPRISWFGRHRYASLVTSGGRYWLSPPLKPGRYAVTVRGKGMMAGEDLQKNPWPILRLTQANKRKTYDLLFNAERMLTRSVQIDWDGPSDCLSLAIANPYTDFTPPKPNLNFLLNYRNGFRDLEIESVVFHPL